MEQENFFSGGPTHKLLTKLKIERDPGPVILRKILIFSLLAWLPLLILSFIQSSAYNPALKVSLLSDLVVWARFFIALPVLFIAESVIKFQVGNSLYHFVESGIVDKNNIATTKIMP